MHGFKGKRHILLLLLSSVIFVTLQRIVSVNLPVEEDISYNLPEILSHAFFGEQFNQLRQESDQLTKSIGSAVSPLFQGKTLSRIAVVPSRFTATIKPHLLESMKRPPYSLLLALRNARCTGRMSERGNCFPFLRKVNGSLEITLQFRRLMEATMPGVAGNDVRTPVEYPRDFTGTVTRKGDLISYAIDLSARRRNSTSGFSTQS